MPAMGKQVVDAFGHVDCLVNNARLMFDQLAASWEDFLAVNFMGVIHASNGVLPYLWEQRHGS
jgi:NAD(P)-dependent dehydrogenase (short-subunit alcohol dehydrogenase family)